MGEGAPSAGAVSRWWSAVVADAPSALTLLLGEAQARQVAVRAAALWGAVVAATSIVLFLLPRDDLQDVRPATGLSLGIGGLLVALTLLRRNRGLSDRGLLALAVPTFVAMVAMVWALGPALEVGMVALMSAETLVFLFLRRRSSLLVNLVALSCYAALVLLEDGYAAPHLHLIIVGVTVVTSSAITAWVIRHIARLSEQERVAQVELASAHAELAELNQQLAAQVDEQGAEIGSLRRLRQFLSPQVAEAVLQDGIEALVPHRCRIAVLFCDLRGFTSFCSSAEPEEVMEVLDRYYTTVGRTLNAAHATVGTFAGDGIMAYFGDPVPHDDPAGTAVSVAIDLREPMAEMVVGWARRGFDLGYGIGIAYGYATIGPVGFEERTDYTALGPTVNLASRLCGLAGDGDVLIDGRAYEAVEASVEAEERLVEVRGYNRPVVVHKVLARSARPVIVERS